MEKSTDSEKSSDSKAGYTIGTIFGLAFVVTIILLGVFLGKCKRDKKKLIDELKEKEKEKEEEEDEEEEEEKKKKKEEEDSLMKMPDLTNYFDTNKEDEEEEDEDFQNIEEFTNDSNVVIKNPLTNGITLGDANLNAWLRQPNKELKQNDSWSFGYLHYSNPKYWCREQIDQNFYDQEISKNLHRFNPNCTR